MRDHTLNRRERLMRRPEYRRNCAARPAGNRCFRRVARALPLVAAGIAVLIAGPGRADDTLPGRAVDSAHVGLWRRAENDGLVCLFLQLRWMGYDRTFQEYFSQVVRSGAVTDLKSLSTAAANLGFTLVPVSMTMAELETARAPILVHLEPQGRGAGYFVVVVGVDDREITVIHGGTATLEPMPRDTFRREWSSLALVPQRPRSRTSAILRVLAAAALAAGAFAIGNRVLLRKQPC